MAERLDVERSWRGGWYEPLLAVVPLDQQAANHARLVMLVTLGVGLVAAFLVVIGCLRRSTRLQDFLRDHLAPRIVPIVTVVGIIIAVMICGRFASRPSRDSRLPSRASSAATSPNLAPAPRTAAADQSTAAADPSTAVATDHAWTMERGGWQRLGVSELTSSGPSSRGPSSRGPSSGQRRWQRWQDEEAFYSSPTLVGDRLYCVATSGDRARILCLDAATGKEHWNAAPSGYQATFSSPVVAGDLLFVGEGLHRARRARLVAIDLRPDRAGRILWTFPTAGHIECTPTIAHGHVYFAAGDDGIYCLKIPALPADPNQVAKPELVFHLPGSQYTDAETSLAVYAGRLYVGLGVGGHALCIFDAHTGEQLRRVALSLPAFSPPSFDASHIYLGLGDANYANPAAATRGQLVCLRQKDGVIDWSIDLPGAVLGAVAVEGGELFWGCGDGRIYRLNLANRRLADFDTGAPVAASLAVTRERIYAVNQNGLLFGIDRTSWSPLFRQVLGEPGAYVSSPAVRGERLFVGTPTAGLIAVGE